MKRLTIGVAGMLLGILALASGCSSTPYEVADVSGVVYLDDKPLPNATVTFIPEVTEARSTVGSGSFGKTDSEGRYTLRLIENDRPGAAVGRHQVRVSAPQGDDPTQEGTVVFDPVPAVYHGSDSPLSMEVSSAGNSAADVKVMSRPR